MKDIIAKLTAIEGKKQLNEGSQWEEDTRGLDEPPAPIGEAGPPMLSKVYPDTRDGVLEYMQYGYDKSFLRKLDLPTCKIHADPSVEGVWAVDSMASGFRCIIYLAGYNDPWGQKREDNDNEEGGFTMSYMKKLVEHDSLNPKLMKHWVKCGSLEQDDMAKLMEYYSQNYGIDEALLSGPTQKYNEPDEDYNDGDPESDNYCDSCGENFPMDYDSCPNCTDEVDEANLNEYLVKEGNTFDSILALNIFCDLYGEESIANYEEEFAESRRWKQVVRKYAPIAKKLEREIKMRKGQKLTQEEAEVIENSWYDGSDAYDDVNEADSLIEIYDAQIRAVESVLRGEAGGGLEEATNHMGEPEYHSFHGWRAACRKVNSQVWFDGDKEIAQAMVGHRPYRRGETHSIGEWDGAVGVVYKQEDTAASGWDDGIQYQNGGNMFGEGDSGWDEEDEPGWMSGPEDERDPDTMPGGHDDLATRGIGEANTIVDPHSMGMPSIADNKMWKVTYWVEEKSYDDRPGREYEDSVTVRASSAQEAFEKVKARPKQTGKMRYDFKVTPASSAELDEVFDSPRGQVARKSYQKKAGEAIRKAQLSGDRDTLEKRATGVARSYQPPKQKQSAFQTSEGKTTMRNKNTISESADFGNASPELIKILRHFGKEVADFQQGGELDDSLYDALYDYYFDDMPYGTKKARTGDPYEWIADRLDRDIGTHNSMDPFDADDPAPGINQSEHDIMGEKEYGNFDSIVSMPKEGAAGDIMPLEGMEESGTLNTPGSIAGSVSPVPEPGEEVITELQSSDEDRITDMLSNIGLDHGLDFWFEGDEIVVIGRKEAKLVTTTVGGHIQSVDGEEYRIGMKPRAAKATPADINDLAAIPELGESVEAEVTEELTEEVSADDVELLTMQYKSGQLSYDQFREKLDDLEQTDYSMRQGEMGNPDRQYQMSRDDEDDDFGNSLDGDEFGDNDDNDHDYANALDDEQLEGEFANSAEEPAQPEVHTSTTAMINQGDDLNRPKKQSWPMRNKGDNPMAEARGLMKQYNAMKAAISLK